MPLPDAAFAVRVVTIFGRYKARIVSGTNAEADAALMEELGVLPRLAGVRKPIRIDCAMGQHLRLVEPELLSGSDDDLAQFVERAIG